MKEDHNLQEPDQEPSRTYILESLSEDTWNFFITNMGSSLTSWIINIILCDSWVVCQISELKNPLSSFILGRMLMVPDWSLGGLGHPIHDIMDHHFMWFLSYVPNFSALAWLEVCQEPPVLEVILGGCLWFLTGVLEDWAILDIMDHHFMWFLSCVPNFSALAWLEVCQEPPILEVILGGCWWFLTSSWCFLVVVLDGAWWSSAMRTIPESFVAQL